MRIIAGKARGTHILAPEGRDTRPTLDRVRENLFNMIQPRIPGSRVLDLFAGSGALGLEAVSRGAELAVLADHSRTASRIQKENVQKLRFEATTRVMLADWREVIRQMEHEGIRFDVVFLDPPYEMADQENIISSLTPILLPEAWVVLEHQAQKRVPIPDERFQIVKDRSWGYCGITVYEWSEQK